MAGPFDDLVNQIVKDVTEGGTTEATRPLQRYSETELRQLWRADRITEEAWKQELIARGDSPQQAADTIAKQKQVGVSTATKTAGQLTASESAAVNAFKNSVIAAPATQSTAGAFNQPNTNPTTLQERMRQARAVGENPLVPEGSQAAVGPAGRTVEQIRGTEYRSDAERAWYLAQTGQSPISSRPSGGGSAGGTSGPSASRAAPPPPAPNSVMDLGSRGGIKLGDTMVLSGQQYRPSGAVATQGQDGKWYIPGSQTPFASESAAKAAMPLTNYGAGLTSRLGNSPTAKAAAQGGFGRTIENPLFRTISLDQSIAAGATKGNQVGDILGTSVREGYPSLDITLGGISEGGGLTPVGNMVSPYESFTGQIPGNTSIGESSILGNSGYNTLYWLQQSTGIPEATLARMNLTAPQALQLEQAAATLRAQGLMPDLASLYATNEPLGYEGAAGGSTLKWGSANGGASNTPYDRALNAFLEYADVKTPELTYLPEPSGYGSTQVGNMVTPNSNVDEWGNPLSFGKGGQFMTDEPMVGVGMRSMKPKVVFGEAGPEKVTIDPMRDVTMGRERGMMNRPMMGGGMPSRMQRPDWRQMFQMFQSRFPEISQRVQDAFSQWQQGGGGLRPFATGGQIYAGGNKGFVSSTTQPLYDENGMVTDYGRQLGYESQPQIYGGGATVAKEAPGSRTTFIAPNISRTGQPTTASFEGMSPEQKLQFTNQGGAVGNQRISGPISPTPIGSMPYGNMVLPVYDQLNPTNYSDTLGAPDSYRYVPYNVGGTPALIRVPTYNSPNINYEAIAARDKSELIKAIQNTDPNFTGMGIGFDSPDIEQAVLSGNKQQMIAALYRIDPEAAVVMASQLAQQPTPTDPLQGDNTPTSQDIQNQAYRQRYREGPDAFNRSRAGLRMSTMLNIPRVENWQGTGPAPYQQFTGTVPEGYVLPYDYEPGGPWFNRSNQPMPELGGGMPGRGGWGGGDVRTPEPWGGTPEPGTVPGEGTPWGAQLPAWLQGGLGQGLRRRLPRGRGWRLPVAPALGAGLAA